MVKKLKKINIRSLWLNFKLFPFKQAIKFPLFISSNVKIVKIWRGGIQINCNEIKPAMIQIGYSNVGTIDAKKSHSVLEISKTGRVVFSGAACFGAGCTISVGADSELFIGKSFCCTGNTKFICQKKISIGNECLVSWDCLFMDTDFHKIYSETRIINAPKEIDISDKVWIGCRSTVLKGTKIPKGSVIGANSLISKVLLDENCVYVGNPIEIKKRNIVWSE